MSELMVGDIVKYEGVVTKIDDEGMAHVRNKYLTKLISSNLLEKTGEAVVCFEMTTSNGYGKFTFPANMLQESIAEVNAANMDVDDKIILRLVALTRAEIQAMPEFDGF